MAISNEIRVDFPSLGENEGFARLVISAFLLPLDPTVEELAEDLRLGRADPAVARDRLLQTMACKSAIKAGMHTSSAELQALVEQVQSGRIQYCPHGRPVAVKLTRYEIEKMFKRA